MATISHLMGFINIWENASLNVKVKSVLSVMLWRQIWFRIGQIPGVQSLWWPLGHHQLRPCQQWLTVNCDSLIVRVGVMHSAHLLMSPRYPDVTRIRRECPDMQTWYQRPGQHALRIARLSCITCCQYFNMRWKTLNIQWLGWKMGQKYNENVKCCQ